MRKSLKNSMLAFALLPMLSVTGACSDATIKGSKNYVTKDVEVSQFDEIKLVGSPDLVYTQSADGSTAVQVSGSDNLVDLIDVRVEGATLIVSYKKREGLNITLNNNSRLKVTASSPSIKAATLSGSGDIILAGNIVTEEIKINLIGSGDINTKKIATRTAEVSLSGSGDISIAGLTANDAKVNLKGSGDIDANSLKCINLTARLNGSGDIELHGTAQNTTYSLKGSGDIDAEGLACETSIANTSGSGEITCKVSKELTGKVSGSGSIQYAGSPVVNDKSNKPGKIRKL